MHDFEIFIPIALFISIAYSIKVVTENRLRNSLIKRGLVKDELKIAYSQNWEMSAPSSLKWGIVLIFMGLAFLFIYFIPEFDSEKLMAAVLFVMAGLGFIAYYGLGSYMSKKQPDSMDIK
ncbi:hypothetical protein JW960_05050 [candidate division KSB1 bacterium]|nr:hypothetical protein [candidate division KSB1 bacterium]